MQYECGLLNGLQSIRIQFRNAYVAFSSMAQIFFQLHASNNNQQLSRFRSIPYLNLLSGINGRQTLYVKMK